MHACMAYLLALKTPKNVPITGESNMCDISKNSKVEILAKKKTMCFLFQEGLFYGQMGIGMYEMTVICLDGSKKKCKFLF